MYPKYILVSSPGRPLEGTFVYGEVWQHKDLLREWEAVHGYGKVHGGGWYLKDDAARTITLYGSSGDYGAAKLAFLNRIPSELRGYKFLFSPSPGVPGAELPLEDVEWV